ncbi:MAG: hypothetical protein WBW81_09235 [Methylocella sp.]
MDADRLSDDRSRHTENLFAPLYDASRICGHCGLRKQREQLHSDGNNPLIARDFFDKIVDHLGKVG